MKRTALGVLLFAATATAAACSGGSNPPTTPTATSDRPYADESPSPTATPTAMPAPLCHGFVPPELCTFAAVVEDAIAAGDVAPILAGSRFDRATLERDLAETGVVHVIAIACPKPLDGATSCDTHFGLLLSTDPVTEPGGRQTRGFWMAFDRLATGGQRLVRASEASDRALRRAALDGVETLGGLDLGPAGTQSAAALFTYSRDGSPPINPFPDEVNAVPVRPLAVNPDPVSIPEDGMLIVQDGCWGCEGGPRSIDRVYALEDGVLIREKLFESGPGMVITSLDVGSSPWALFTARCVRGQCIYLDEGDHLDRVGIYRSLDGGITWESLGDSYWNTSVHARGIEALGIIYRWDPSDGVAISAATFPGGTELPLLAPSGAELYPVVLGGEIGFRSADGGRILRGDGWTLFDPALDAYLDAPGIWVTRDPYWDRTLVTWAIQTLEGRARSYLAVYRGQLLTAVFETTDLYPYGATFVDDNTVLVNVDYSVEKLGLPPIEGRETLNFPMQLNLHTGELRPLEPKFFADAYGGGRMLISGYWPGPLVRVEAGEGDCLNVRPKPSVMAESIRCFATGVLLRDLRERAQEGTGWVLVEAPSGDRGYAATEFLSR